MHTLLCFSMMVLVSLGNLAMASAEEAWRHCLTMPGIAHMWNYDQDASAEENKQRFLAWLTWNACKQKAKYPNNPERHVKVEVWQDWVKTQKLDWYDLWRALAHARAGLMPEPAETTFEIMQNGIQCPPPVPCSVATAQKLLKQAQAELDAEQRARRAESPEQRCPGPNGRVTCSKQLSQRTLHLYGQKVKDAQTTLTCALKISEN